MGQLLETKLREADLTPGYLRVGLAFGIQVQRPVRTGGG